MDHARSRNPGPSPLRGSLCPGFLYVLHQGFRKKHPIYRGFSGTWHCGPEGTLRAGAQNICARAGGYPDYRGYHAQPFGRSKESAC